MKYFKSLATVSRVGIGVLLMFLTLAAIPQYADANTAANTAIINTVTVNFKDAGGTAQTAVTASATVTVTLVAVAPTLSTPGDQNTTLATAATYTYTITANSNGPESYAISTALNGGSVTNTAHILTSSAVPSTTPIVLGATTIITPVTITAAGTTAIVVPSDGVSNASVNGIITGATVVINTQVYTVASIVDNAAGTSTITLNGNGTASAALTYGTLIGEQKTFTLAVTPLTMNATTTNETITTIVSAKSAPGAAATDSTTTTVPAANLTVTKEVSLTGLAASWAATASAAPTTPLFYRITVHNGGAGNATAVVITDPLTSYTSYTAGSAKRANAAGANYADGTNVVLTDLFGDADGFDYGTTPGTITYTLPAAIAAGADVVLLFKVTVK